MNTSNKNDRKNIPFFNDYQILNDRVNNSCSDLMRDYPNLWIVIEKVIRVNLSKLDVYYMIPSRKKLFISFFYQKLFFFLSKFSVKSKCDKCVVALQKFPNFSNVLQDELEVEEYCVIKSLPPSFYNIWTIFRSNYIFIGLLGMPIINYRRIINLITKKQNYFSENEHKLLQKADSHAQKHIANLTNYFINQKIKAIIAAGSTSFASATLCAAAEKLAVNFIVLAHGYIGNRSLATIAPIRATYLVVWSKSQLTNMSKSLDEIERAKLIYLGFPGLKLKYFNQTSKNKILFAITTLSKIQKKKEALVALKYLIRKLALNYECTIRLHPKDYKKAKCIIKELEIEPNSISKNTLEKDLSESMAVIATGSSVLFEAYANNIDAYNLSEFSNSAVDEVKSLYSHEILDSIINNVENSSFSNNVIFLEENVSQFIQLISSKSSKEKVNSY